MPRYGSRTARAFRPSLHAELTAHIRNMILRHELKPSEWVDEAALCEKLGVSKTPMREALKVLAAEGLVELHPNQGARVAALLPEHVDDLFEAQAIIEGNAARLACQHATEKDVEMFAKIHGRMVRAFKRKERKQYFALNQDLHLALVSMSHNTALVMAHSTLFMQIERARYLALDVGRRWEDSVAQHEEILAALSERDGARAQRLVETHVVATQHAVRRAVERQYPDEGPDTVRRARTRPKPASTRRRRGPREATAAGADE